MRQALLCQQRMLLFLLLLAPWLLLRMDADVAACYMSRPLPWQHQQPLHL
jgi:hypothetical protein